MNDGKVSNPAFEMSRCVAWRQKNDERLFKKNITVHSFVISTSVLNICIRSIGFFWYSRLKGVTSGLPCEITHQSSCKLCP